MHRSNNALFTFKSEKVQLYYYNKFSTRTRFIFDTFLIPYASIWNRSEHTQLQLLGWSAQFKYIIDKSIVKLCSYRGIAKILMQLAESSSSTRNFSRFDWVLYVERTKNKSV